MRAGSGFTLVETLVALAVLVAVSGALVGLQTSSVRAQRTAVALHAAAATLKDELALQRVVAGAAGGACLTTLAEGVSCEVERTCVGGPEAPCGLVAVLVRVGTSGGGELEARSVASAWLEGRP